MKKLSVILLFATLISSSLYSQVGVKISSLPPNEVKNYVKPASTWFGTYFNSGTYYDADVDDTFGFKFNIVGMWTLIPDDQKTFQPNPQLEGVETPDPTATVFGNKSSYFLSKNGFFTYPAGFALNAIPSGIVQVSGSFFNTELMLRLFPKSKFENTEVGLFGFGIKHDISSHIPLLPIDISVQILYNNFSIEYSGDIEDYTNVQSSNFAFNVHASKTFASVFIVYGGLQYESTSMDFEYYFKDPNDLYPNIADQNHKQKIDGDNNFRLTIGSALKLGFFVMNADVNLTKLTTFTFGLSFDF